MWVLAVAPCVFWLPGLCLWGRVFCVFSGSVSSGSRVCGSGPARVAVAGWGLPPAPVISGSGPRPGRPPWRPLRAGLPLGGWPRWPPPGGGRCCCRVRLPPRWLRPLPLGGGGPLVLLRWPRLPVGVRPWLPVSLLLWLLPGGRPLPLGGPGPLVLLLGLSFLCSLFGFGLAGGGPERAGPHPNKTHKQGKRNPQGQEKGRKRQDAHPTGTKRHTGQGGTPRRDRATHPPPGAPQAQHPRRPYQFFQSEKRFYIFGKTRQYTNEVSTSRSVFILYILAPNGAGFYPFSDIPYSIFIIESMVRTCGIGPLCGGLKNYLQIKTSTISLVFHLHIVTISGPSPVDISRRGVWGRSVKRPKLYFLYQTSTPCLLGRVRKAPAFT